MLDIVGFSLAMLSIYILVCGKDKGRKESGGFADI
jgi:hypothetical protein